MIYWKSCKYLITSHDIRAYSTPKQSQNLCVPDDSSNIKNLRKLTGQKSFRIFVAAKKKYLKNSLNSFTPQTYSKQLSSKKCVWLFFTQSYGIKNSFRNLATRESCEFLISIFPSPFFLGVCGFIGCVFFPPPQRQIFVTYKKKKHKFT